ncbi:MAG: bifunctional adenosylcobinamide kinase/adenosylcobinamide-phosphate guanylyltransferase [Deltaproteobacteria bacterium]
MSTKLIFITGGARSGKSAFALKLAESMPGNRLYLATAEALDNEMLKRIKRHKKERGNNWKTIESPIKITEVIKKNTGYDVILLDCLTLWISNMMHTANRPSPFAGNGKGEGGITKEIHSLISACKASKTNIIIVSNEVGLGIVPDNPLARRFRDISGISNQKMAEAADEVYFVVSGMEMRMR